MKNISYLILVVLLILNVGCGKIERAAIKIDDIRVTEDEFEDAFAVSRFAPMGVEGRERFLESYIAAKLILSEAEKLGLDKDHEFISEIQFFWEKALLKMMLSRKSDELASRVDITDNDVRKYYRNHKELFGEKEISEVYDQIKWYIFQEKQAQAMEKWADSLKEKANIKVNYGLLGIQE